MRRMMKTWCCAQCDDWWVLLAARWKRFLLVNEKNGFYCSLIQEFDMIPIKSKIFAGRRINIIDRRINSITWIYHLSIPIIIFGQQNILWMRLSGPAFLKCSAAYFSSTVLLTIRFVGPIYRCKHRITICISFTYLYCFVCGHLSRPKSWCYRQ